MIRRFSYFVEDTLGGEMDIHSGYMERLGITDEEVARASKSLANASYTSYMLEVGFRGNELDILVAILSCCLLYTSWYRSCWSICSNRRRCCNRYNKDE